MAEYPIIMKQKNGQGGYDTLYPKTLGSQVEGTIPSSQITGTFPSSSIIGQFPASQIDDIYTKSQTLTQTTATLFGLGPDSVPDDVLALLSKAAITKKVGGDPIRTETPLKNLPYGTKLYSDSADFNGTAYPTVIVTGITNYPTSGVALIAVKTNSGSNTGVNYGYWDNNSKSTYSGSSADANADNVTDKLPPSMQAILRNTTISVDGTTLSRKSFLPSGTELGFSEAGLLVEGRSILSSHVSDLFGNAWTRSTFQDAKTLAWAINGSSISASGKNQSKNFVYLLSVDVNAKVYLDDDGKYYIEQKYTDIKKSFTTVTGEDFSGAVNIATGSYVGTGTYGASNPNSLSFEFGAKLVWIYRCDNSGNRSNFNAISLTLSPDIKLSTEWSVQYNYTMYTSDLSLSSISWSEDFKTVSWYADTADDQANCENYTYYYIAIG